MTEIQPQFDRESATIESPGREALQRLPGHLGAVLVDHRKHRRISPRRRRTRKRYYNPRREIDFMRRGITGHGGPERTGPDQVNAALVRQLIGDNLQIAEYAVKSRRHFAPSATAHTAATARPLCIRRPGQACDIDRQGTKPHSPGASGMPEK